MNKILNLQAEVYRQPLSLLIKILQLVCRIYIKFTKDAGFARAGSLAFTTLLSVVPFAAVVISLLNAFGALVSVQNQITGFIVQLLVPTKQAEVNSILEHFLENSDKLGVVGLIFFILTSILLLNTINVNLNAVWGSRVKKNFLSKFTTYASVIIVGTLLLAVSTSISSSLNFSFVAVENFAWFNRLILRITPFIVEFLLIMLITGLAPSGKVKFKSICIASLSGAIFWELAKYGFVNISSWAIRASVIYGTMAVIPIFLFWVYILWMIIIGSMELAWIHQHWGTTSNGVEVFEMNPVERLIFGFQIYLKISENFQTGDKPLTVDDLCLIFSSSIIDIMQITSMFVENDLLLTVGEEPMSWVPARSLSGITGADLIESLFGRFKPSSDHKLEAVKQIYKFYNHGTEALRKYSIEDLLNSI
ncbi:MAG: YihY family inner membrane protein [Spirochaetales bacterium]|nr:YihY family inner membrane protein [Spirochaetales bacterium]